ncbi:uracil-DNA glycosylase [Oceaniglobus indicus]|uniref:uracil-DNA glycosylase n=1 Tax=Oceaniglobus indicus TaxID=2047749 RepID=UPI000C1A0DD0|nr:uracil-DNA glycosylase [Oceaniglobus indicus]
MDSQASSPDDWWHAAALLEWQVELGATEAIGEAPVNRYELPAAPARPASPQAQPDARKRPTPPPPPIVLADPVADAQAAAAGATTLAELRDAMAAFEGCELRKGARNLVFSDGDPGARVMIVGEAPGREEDARGKPFIGKAGQFLDRMFDAIGLSRTASGADGLYITNTLPWHPPGNRDPDAAEIAMMLPFVHRHIELAAPDILILMGNVSCLALLGRKGITRLRGAWTEALGRPTLPMFHPAYLLRNPPAKREAWHDLLMLRARLRQ